MRKIDAREYFWMTILSLLCLICFPLNPLVLIGWIEPAFYLPATILGWLVWLVGMVLVLAPMILFPRRGGVPHGKSFVHTTQLVDSGIYALVRHPQYLGGILSIFVATVLLYPHWLFAILAIPGIIILYWSAKEEEKLLIAQFGNAYRAYSQRVPRMNLILGIYRQLKQSRS